MKYTIIGAGIGGLATALVLEKKGIDYHVFERAPQLNEVGAGIWLAPNALQVLDSLGLLEEVQSKGNSIDRITLAKADLSPLSDMDQSGVKERFGFSTIAIHRAKLQRLLFDNVPKERISLGYGFKTLEVLPSGNIKIEFANSDTVVTDYLIGADGINSKVRTHIKPESVIRYSGQTCWRGVADFNLDADFEHRGMELWGDQVRFGISKVEDNNVYWFAVGLAEANQKDKALESKVKLLRMFANFHPLCQQLITATEDHKILRNDISDLKPLKTWHKGNICLIGDAGHATTPNMGQGGAQAIEDAYYLGELIGLTPDENVFESFERKRKKKVDKIVSESWLTGKIAHWKYGTGLRNTVLKYLPQSIMEKKLRDIYQLEKIIPLPNH